MHHAWEPVDINTYHGFVRSQFRSVCAAAGIELVFADTGPDLGELACWLRIDGKPCLYCINDYGYMVGANTDPILMVQALPWQEHFDRACSLPSIGWVSWETYQQALAMPRKPNGKAIARMMYGSAALNDRPGRTARRAELVKMLADALDDKVLIGPLGWPKYLPDFVNSSVVVHTGGGFPGSWDRTSAMAFSLGIPLVQPEIMTIVGSERPRSGTHYLACRDDCQDAAGMAKQLLHDKKLARRIGEAAQMFYRENLDPKAMWRRVTWWLHARQAATEWLAQRR